MLNGNYSDGSIFYAPTVVNFLSVLHSELLKWTMHSLGILAFYESQEAGAGFNLQHFYHQGDPVFQVWNCHKNHPQCLFSSSTVTPPMLIFQKLESTNLNREYTLGLGNSFY